MVDMQLLNSFPAPFQAQEAPTIFDKKPFVPEKPFEQTYEHTQIGTNQIGLVAISVLAFLLFVPYYGWGIILVAIAIVIGQIAFRGTLSVTVDDDALSIQYGPLSWSAKSWPIAEIASVSVVKLPWNNLFGGGLSFGGKIYNTSGLDGVEIRMLNGKTFRIGTDEPEDVRHAIESRKI